MSLIQFGDKLSKCLRSKTLSYGAFNKKMQPYINDLKQLAFTHRVRVLASNQIGLSDSVFVMLPQQAEMLPSQYIVCFNPKILKISHEINEVNEESPSFPYFKAKVKRYNKIYAMYDTLKGKDREQEFSGNEAIWFQQGLDQLMGLNLLNWLVSQGNIQIKDQYIQQAVFEEFKKKGRQYDRMRGLSQLNLMDDHPSYCLNGPTHEVKEQEEFDLLYSRMENEAFYTFD